MTQSTGIDFDAIVAGAFPPNDTTDVGIRHVLKHPSGKLPSGDPSGIGAVFAWSVHWIIRGRETGDEIAEVSDVRDAIRLRQELTGEKGELWRRKEARRAAIAAMDAAEAEAAREAQAAKAAKAARKQKRAS